MWLLPYYWQNAGPKVNPEETSDKSKLKAKASLCFFKYSLKGQGQETQVSELSISTHLILYSREATHWMVWVNSLLSIGNKTP